MNSSPLPRHALILPLFLVLAACGPSDPRALTNEAKATLAAGDAAKAEQQFREALGGLKPGDPDFARASIGRIQALARLDAARAKDEFLAYSQANKSSIAEEDYSLVVSELLRRENTLEAIEVMDAGIKAFPESPRMAAVKKEVAEAAQKAKDPAAMQKLKGLGYIGGDK